VRSIDSVRSRGSTVDPLPLLNMAKKTLTDEELLSQLDSIGSSGNTPRKPAKSSAASKPGADAALAELAELEELVKAPAAPVRTSTSRDSRPNTPKLSGFAPRASALAASGRTSEDRTRPPAVSGRRSGESAGEESAASGYQVTPPSSEGDASGASPTAGPVTGGWWGGLVAIGSAAVKQAGQAVKEIQQNEEAQKWADQVRGNVGVLRDLGMVLQCFHRSLLTCPRR
jgi:Family of unknown function (DUF5427)